MKLDKFDTPARIRDVPLSSKFYNAWHEAVDLELGDGNAGNTGTFFINQARVENKVIASKSMVWMGFPRRVLLPGLRDDKIAAYKLADVLRLDPSHPQDEYFEWYVHRDSSKKITKVTFVTEFRLYYEELWRVDPKVVLSIYKKHVSSNVKLDHLQKNGEYDSFNKWNTKLGIMHYTQAINTLGAAVGLANISVNVTPEEAINNYESDVDFRKTTTSVDPRINYDINMLTRNKLSSSLKDPIGIYIIDWNNSGITLPNGRPAPYSWWKIKRGRVGQVLRLEYSVPRSKGYVVGDLKLAGEQIEYGGQLAEQVTVGLTGNAHTR